MNYESLSVSYKTCLLHRLSLEEYVGKRKGFSRRKDAGAGTAYSNHGAASGRPASMQQFGNRWVRRFTTLAWPWHGVECESNCIGEWSEIVISQVLMIACLTKNLNASTLIYKHIYLTITIKRLSIRDGSSFFVCYEKTSTMQMTW